MKKIHLILGLLTLICGQYFISCANSTNTTTSPIVNPIEEARITNVKNGLNIPEKVTNLSYPLSMPKTIDDVKIKWTVSDNEVIKVDTGIIEPKETDTLVKITANLKYKTLTAERSFDVLVIGKKTVLTDDIILDLAAERLPKSLPFNSRIMEHCEDKFTLLKVSGYYVEGTIDINSNSKNLISEKTRYILKRDFNDYDVKYKATLTYNGKTKIIERSMTVPKITEYIQTISTDYTPTDITQTVTFFSDYFEVINKGVLKNGTRYSYKIDPVTKTMQVEEIAYYDIDKWVTRKEEMQKELDSDIVYFNALKKFDNNPSFEGYKLFLKEAKKDESDRYEYITVSDLGQYMNPKIEINNYLDTDAINKFNACSLEKKDLAAKKFLEVTKKERIAEGYTIDSYIATYKEKFNDLYDIFFPAFSSKVKYSISNNELHIASEYNNKEPWYKQNGVYLNTETGKNEYYFQKLDIYNYYQKLGMLHRYDDNLHYSVGVVAEFKTDDFSEFKILEGKMKNQLGKITYDANNKEITISMVLNGETISYNLGYSPVYIIK